MGQVKAPKMSCESHPLPPYFETESDDEAGEGSPQHEDACGDLTMTWRCELPCSSSPAIPEMVERLDVAIGGGDCGIEDAAVEDDEFT